MTTLYRPVLIESAEQANALPRGTVATSGHYESFGPFAAIRTGDVPDWYMTTAPDTWADSAEVIGWTALVPIEAEEETVERHRLCREVPDVLHRFTTPWTLYTAKETP